MDNLKICWFSTGISSFVACYLAKDVDEIIYTHVPNQHPDSFIHLEQLPRLGSHYSQCLKCADEHEQLALWLEELKRYKEMESQRLLMKLPCSIGTEIYKIPSKVKYDLNVLNGYKTNNRVYHQKVYNIVISQNGWFIQCDKDSIYAPDVICIDSEYGQTWFTNREEAEKKLATFKLGEIREENEIGQSKKN